MKLQNFIMSFFTSTDASFDVSLVYFWLIFAFFFLIMEMASPGLFFFSSFFFGGLIAAVASFFIQSIAVQVVCFLMSTGIALLILRYWVVPIMNKSSSKERTNVYALKGQRGFVIKNINFEHPGLVKVNGQTWPAKIMYDEAVVKGDIIEVVDVRGAHVVVKKV